MPQHLVAVHGVDQDRGVRDLLLEQVAHTVGAVPDELVDQVTATIARTARTDKIGDGKIFVLDLLSATRIRTGETGDTAL